MKTKKEGVEVNRFILDALDILYQLPVYKVAYVEGNVYGGGMELLSCFDKVVATKNTKFAFWQKKQGLSTGWGGYTRWSQTVDAKILDKLIDSTEMFGSEEAMDFNFVDSIVESVGEVDLSGISAEAQSLDYTKEIELFESLWWSKEHLKVLGSLEI